MLRLLPASEREHLGHGPFRIARIRPGRILGPEAEPALGPLSVIDRATLTDGAFVPMHTHVNDEILSWVTQGTMVHEDSTGDRRDVSADNLMLMNAGAGFRYQEGVTGETVEMLQIFVRPSAADLKPQVQFWQGWSEATVDGWRRVAEPEGAQAPLTFRQAVTVLDRRAGAGEIMEMPRRPGLKPWLYLMEGEAEAGNRRLRAGDALADVETAALPPLTIMEAATLVLFLVDRAAPASRASTISGR